jgi:hypothetical protein
VAKKKDYTGLTPAQLAKAYAKTSYDFDAPDPGLFPVHRILREDVGD